MMANLFIKQLRFRKPDALGQVSVHWLCRMIAKSNPEVSNQNPEVGFAFGSIHIIRSMERSDIRFILSTE